MDRIKRDFSLMVAVVLLATAVGASGCIKIEKGGDCPEGSRGCACMSNGKCKSADLFCVDSMCVKEGAASTKNGGGISSSNHSASGSGDESSNGSSGESSGGSAGESGSVDGGAAESSGPSCTDLHAGTQRATAADSALCNPSPISFSVTIGDGAQVESIDGRTCTLSRAGVKCYDTAPDVYQCGDCEFNVGVQSLFMDGKSVDVGWTISASSCGGGCAKYCCASDSGTMFESDFWLDQKPASSSGGGSSSGGSSDACSRCSDACSGIPGCSCCAECGGMCFN